MKLIIIIAICILTLQAESQSYFRQSQHYNEPYTGRNYPVNTVQNNGPYLNHTVNNINPSQSLQFGPNGQIDKQKISERDSYLQAISRNDNTAGQQLPQQEAINNDKPIYFPQPSEDLSPPPFGENPNQSYYSTQQSNGAFHLPTSGPENVDDTQRINTEIYNSISNNVTVAVSSFGLSLVKIVSQLKPGNVIVSPTSITTLLALLQQGATGDAQNQITRSLQMTPDVSKIAFSNIAAAIKKRNSRNILSVANSIFVSDAFDLNNVFKRLAVQNFWSEVSAMNFANPSVAIQIINSWVASKTNNKITNLLSPGAVSPATQLALLNAVYFKGIWETKFKPERTMTDTFHLSNGEKKEVPFMNIRHSFQVGFDLNTRALVTILPFEANQYSLILILPKKTDNVANVLSTLSVDQLLYYQTFAKTEMKVALPKFTIKTDTDLNPVLRSMGITNIFGPKSELTGIGLYRTTSPQISNAVHSGFLSVDEQGVTAAAATGVVAIALSFDDSSIIFRGDRPFIAILWDNQLSIPMFISKIEDPS